MNRDEKEPVWILWAFRVGYLIPYEGQDCVKKCYGCSTPFTEDSLIWLRMNGGQWIYCNDCKIHERIGPSEEFKL